MTPGHDEIATGLRLASQQGGEKPQGFRTTSVRKRARFEFPREQIGLMGRGFGGHEQRFAGDHQLQVS